MAFLTAPASRTIVVPSRREGLLLRELESKDPDACLQYQWALTEWLEAEGTTLTYYAVAIDAPAAPALLVDSTASDAPEVVEPEEPLDPLEGFVVAEGAQNVVAWLSAGVLLVEYVLRLRFKTAAGHTEDCSFLVTVRRR